MRVVLLALMFAVAACSRSDVRPVVVRSVAPPTSTTVALRGDAVRFVPRPVPTTRASRSRGVGGRATEGVHSRAAGVRPTTDPATARVSWYGSESGSRTANGEAFDGSDYTFAARSRQWGRRIRFCYEGRCVVARQNDYGPAVRTGRLFDLSRASFAAIAPLDAGVVTVTWVVV